MTKKMKERLKWFGCDCCGASFQDYLSNQAHHDKDDGCGLCVECDKMIAEKNEEEWIKIEDKVVNSLNPVNRAKFLAYELGVRRGLILEMMDAGLIKWTIGGKQSAING